MADDFHPIVITDAMSITATQLGIEVEGVAPRFTPFQRVYPRVGLTTRLLTAQFPIANMGGVLGLRSLASGESSAVHFDVYNGTTKTLGATSGRRSVCVSLWLVNDGTALPINGLALPGECLSYTGRCVRMRDGMGARMRLCNSPLVVCLVPWIRWCACAQRRRKARRRMVAPRCSCPSR